MKRILLSFSFFIFSFSFCYSQSQLFFENFETGGNTFVLDSTSAWNNTGNNKWLVNNVYTGAVLHPSTISEDSTYGGSISYAPFGHYLHIYDSASGFLNDNFNPADSSDRFAGMRDGICTKSLTSVAFNFFYLCRGSANAYGVVYYSVNGGTWTQTGNILDNKYKWQYTTITNPAFNNVEDLRFGFRWINKNTTGHDTTALGIDDVSLVGTYDSINHPIKCTWVTGGIDSCLGNAYIFLEPTLSDSSCTSVWEMYMSNDIGNFPGPYIWNATIGPNLGNDLLSYWYLPIPNTYSTVGHCYRFKLVRQNYPFLTFLDSVCFPFDSCPGSIIAMQPAVTLDTNPVCAGSVIDVPFSSTGTYKTTNIYTAELIDSIGTTAVTYTLGTLASSSSYPYPYGNVPGVIPLTAPAGCKYYVKVISTTPNRQAFLWGPFCIQHCDILSGKQDTIKACLGSCYKDPSGFTDSTTYNIHEFDNRAKYASGNDFEVQVLNSTTFQVVNMGSFGLKVDTTSGKMHIHIPCVDSLNLLGIQPGLYYLRLIATKSNFSDSSLGTVVFLLIGEPADSLYITATPPGGPYCEGTVITFNASPNDYYTINSTYTWTDAPTNHHTPNIWPDFPYDINLLTSTADTFLMSCQENNYGCLGPIATYPDTIVVLGKPNISKTGPTHICFGDTGTFSIPFADNTVYTWRVRGRANYDTANNVLKVKYDTLGTFKITVVAINACFADSAVWTVKSDTCNFAGIPAIKKPSIAVYPNPSRGQFVFTLKGGTYVGARIEVYNILGGMIANQTIGSISTLIDLGSNPNGIYYYRVIAGDGTNIGNGKLVIQR